jgi:hypothetical protein
MCTHLDANAWIKVFSDSELYLLFRGKFLEGTLNVGLTQQVVDELTTALDQERPALARSNLLHLKPFMKEVGSDGIIILGYSKFDKAKFATEPIGALYANHLERKQLKKNNIRDGIHLVNAFDAKATLVTCDSAVIKTAQKEGVPTVCFGTFIRVNNLKDMPDCSSCISLDNITLVRSHSG